ncbi:MAG: C40 family peptidase [Bacteroidales bacterium]|jgi:hypothetical protein|nr:C40 family peptidase [Bacteroidales bacterium]
MKISEGICLLGMSPMRADSSERSEMVSQLLFGDSFSVLREKGAWLYIRTHADDYAGWVSANMVALGVSARGRQTVVSVPFIACRILPDSITIHLPGGSILPEQPFEYAGKTYMPENIPEGTGREVVSLAEQYLGAPYLWGGKTVFGTDCSGLVQVICRMAGKWLPRDAGMQEKCGTPTVYEDASRGDIAFFADEHGKVIHTGFLCGDGSILHASGCVRKDRFDAKGIFNTTENKYTHSLYSIKKM